MGYMKATLLIIATILIRKGLGYESAGSGHQFYPPPLVSPQGGTFKLIVGYAVPVELSGRILVYGQNFQFQYALAQNASFFTNHLGGTSRGHRRRRRTKNLSTTNDRLAFYKLVEKDLARKGIDGRSCLKQDICEAAAAPLKDEGLIGELLHLFLTPDYGNYSLMDQEYLEAARLGRNQRDCSEIYRCPPGQGILDKISTMFPANF